MVNCKNMIQSVIVIFFLVCLSNSMKLRQSPEVKTFLQNGSIEKQISSLAKSADVNRLVFARINGIKRGKGKKQLAKLAEKAEVNHLVFARLKNTKKSNNKESSSSKSKTNAKTNAKTNSKTNSKSHSKTNSNSHSMSHSMSHSSSHSKSKMSSKHDDDDDDDEDDRKELRSRCNIAFKKRWLECNRFCLKQKSNQKKKKCRYGYWRVNHWIPINKFRWFFTRFQRYYDNDNEFDESRCDDTTPPTTTCDASNTEVCLDRDGKMAKDFFPECKCPTGCNPDKAAIDCTGENAGKTSKDFANCSCPTQCSTTSQEVVCAPEYNGKTNRDYFPGCQCPAATKCDPSILEVDCKGEFSDKTNYDYFSSGCTCPTPTMCDPRPETDISCTGPYTGQTNKAFFSNDCKCPETCPNTLTCKSFEAFKGFPDCKCEATSCDTTIPCTSFETRNTFPDCQCVATSCDSAITCKSWETKSAFPGCQCVQTSCDNTIPCKSFETRNAYPGDCLCVATSCDSAITCNSWETKNAFPDCQCAQTSCDSSITCKSWETKSAFPGCQCVATSCDTTTPCQAFETRNAFPDCQCKATSCDSSITCNSWETKSAFPDCQCVATSCDPALTSECVDYEPKMAKDFFPSCGCPTVCDPTKTPTPCTTLTVGPFANKNNQDYFSNGCTCPTTCPADIVCTGTDETVSAFPECVCTAPTPTTPVPANPLDLDIEYETGKCRALSDTPSNSQDSNADGTQFSADTNSYACCVKQHKPCDFQDDGSSPDKIKFNYEYENCYCTPQNTSIETNNFRDYLYYNNDFPFPGNLIDPALLQPFITSNNGISHNLKTDFNFDTKIYGRIYP